MKYIYCLFLLFEISSFFPAVILTLGKTIKHKSHNKAEDEEENKSNGNIEEKEQDSKDNKKKKNIFEKIAGVVGSVPKKIDALAKGVNNTTKNIEDTTENLNKAKKDLSESFDNLKGQGERFKKDTYKGIEQNKKKIEESTNNLKESTKDSTNNLKESAANLVGKGDKGLRHEVHNRGIFGKIEKVGEDVLGEATKVEKVTVHEAKKVGHSKGVLKDLEEIAEVVAL